MGQESRLTSERLASMIGLWSSGRGPLYGQLADAVERLIGGGLVRHGDLLPPERRLAATLEVARGTVVSAYGQLAERGLVARVQGSGTRVQAPATLEVETASRIGDPLFDSTPLAIDLLTAVPRVLPRVLDLVNAVDLGRYGAALDDTEPAGILPLRQRIADLMTADGLTTTHQQVLVTTGAQQGIVLSTMLLTKPGDVVLCEAKTWPGLVDNVTRLGGRTHGVAMDANGLIVDELQQAIERMRPAFIALNPHHHNPTGTRLSPDRRRRVAELAREYAVPLVEDRVVARLAFDGQVPPPLAALDAGDTESGPHLVVDSLSKVAWPGLRLGWIRADPRTVTRLRSLRALTDLYSSTHSQIASLAVLDDLDAVLADRIGELRARSDCLLAALAEHLPEWPVDRPRGGLVVWIALPEGSASAFSTHAARFGVLVANGRQFGAGADDGHIRIPFAAPEAELEEGVRRLAMAWREFDPNLPSHYETASLV